MSQPQPLSVNSIQTRSASEGFRPSIETRSAHEGFRPATETRSASEGFPGGMLAMKRTENDSEESLARASGLWGAARRGAFTLIELLITISIIGLMASMVLFATYSAMETAKEQKTRALIAKLDAIIKAKWDAYKTRRINVDFGPDRYDDLDNDGAYSPMDYLSVDHNNDGQWALPPRSYPNPSNNPAMVLGTSPLIASIAKMRLDCLRDLMRMELPDRWTDVSDPPKAPFDDDPSLPAVLRQWDYQQIFKVPRPAVSQAYLQKYNAIAYRTNPPAPPIATIRENQGAECLYMIVMAALEEEGDSRDVFKAGDIGDKDGDGFPEFLDAWGRPINFLRWAPGFPSELQIVASVPPPPPVPPETPDDHTYIIYVNNASFATTTGAYNGCAVIWQDDTQLLRPESMARVTSSSYDPTTGITRLVCTTPPDSYTRQRPFDDYSGSQRFEPGGIALMAPDPFDPAGVYPIYAFQLRPPNIIGAGADRSVPSYALYPLIYSAGADGQYGITDDVPNPVSSPHAYPLSYAGNPTATKGIALYPFYRFPNSSGTLSMIGSAQRDGDSPSAWLDNIHNHTQGQR